MFFGRKKRQQAEIRKEAQIQYVRKDMFKKIDKANASTDKLIELLDNEDLGTTGKIFLAIGGDRRSKL